MAGETCTLSTNPCVLCGRVDSAEVKVENLEAYREGRLFIQDAFPDLSPGFREHLISDMCGDCFDLTFSEGEGAEGAGWFEEDEAPF